jgi:hypothetical protein
MVSTRPWRCHLIDCRTTHGKQWKVTSRPKRTHCMLNPSDRISTVPKSKGRYRTHREVIESEKMALPRPSRRKESRDSRRRLPDAVLGPVQDLPCMLGKDGILIIQRDRIRHRTISQNRTGLYRSKPRRFGVEGIILRQHAFAPQRPSDSGQGRSGGGQEQLPR